MARKLEQVLRTQNSSIGMLQSPSEYVIVEDPMPKIVKPLPRIEKQANYPVEVRLFLFEFLGVMKFSNYED